VGHELFITWRQNGLLGQRQLSCRPKNSGWAGVLLDAGFLQIVPAERRGVY